MMTGGRGGSHGGRGGHGGRCGRGGRGGGLFRGQSRGVRVIGQWQQVTLDPEFLASGDLDGFVCMEELHDYTMIRPEAIEKEDKRNKHQAAEAARASLAKKRKTTADSEPSETADDGGVAVRKEGRKKVDMKKTKKISKKKRMWMEREVLESEATESGVDVGDEEGDEAGEEVEPPGDEVDEDISDRSSKKTKKVQKIKKAKKNKKCMETKETIEEGVAKQTPPSEGNTKKPTSGATKRPWTAGALGGEALGSNSAVDMSAWHGLYVPELVVKALTEMGYTAPTAIQALVLPAAIRDRRDVLGAAETGSGKTLAFGIPMIQRILEWREGTEDADGVTENDNEAKDDVDNDVADDDVADHVDDDVIDDDALETGVLDLEGRGCVRVLDDVPDDFYPTGAAATLGVVTSKPKGWQPLLGLVVTPTRELAVQVKQHLDAAARHTGIRTAVVVGGMAQQKQQRVLSRRPEVVVATPGRLWELIREGHPHLTHMRSLRCLVVDEADRMVERGHFAELSQLLELLAGTEFNPRRQTFVFSATLTLAGAAGKHPPLAKKKKKQQQAASQLDVGGKLEMLIQRIGIRGKPKVVDLTRREATAQTLTESRVHCDADDKDHYLYYFLLRHPGRTMVFANSIECVKRLTGLLSALTCEVLPLHANMHQKQRLKNLEKFAERQSSVLLTTDVAARGLDIPNVENVIHYQLPRTPETYIHRSGRTARASREGLSLVLVGPGDVPAYRKICRALRADRELPCFPVDPRNLAAVKARVTLARSIEKELYHHSRAQQHNSWFQKAADAMDIELEDDMLMGDARLEDTERKHQQLLQSLRKQLVHLLAQPVFRITGKTRYPTQFGALAVPLPASCTDGQVPASALAVLREGRVGKRKAAMGKQKQKNKKKKRQQQPPAAAS